ncbi:MAG: VanW family protein [Clostridiales bacterium]|nr:VanW family protein [Clostridiales bacterium]
MRKVLTVIIVLCGTAAFSVSAAAFEISIPNGDTATEGKRLATDITLDGILLSDYTYPLAYQKFNERTRRLARDFELKVIMNGSEYYLRSEDISIDINTLELLNQLWFTTDQYGEGNTFTSAYSYDKPKVEAFAKGIVDDLNATVPPVKKSAPVFNPQTRTFSDGTAVSQIIGYDLDQSTFLEQIYKKIDDAIWANADHHATLNIKSSPIYSNPAAAAAAGYGRLGTYTTYTTNVPNRNTNISLACDFLTGTLVKPGSTFSFNGALGFTSASRGFKEAGILVNGVPDTGLGGGICQVSSTIYNAVLEAGLRVVERHAHSAAVGYVPKGRDATVSYGGPDFRFQNNTANDLYLILDYNNRTLTVSLYGKK